MFINWGTPAKAKYLTVFYAKDWDRDDFKAFNFRRAPLGWDMNIWRLSVSYDNYGRVK